MELVKEKIKEFTGIRAFKATDMVFIIERGIKEFGLKAMADDHIRELAQAREDNGQCITGVVNDKIIGCGGIDIMWDTVGEVWVLLAYDIGIYSMAAYEVIQDGLKKLIEDNNLRRVQAWGRVGFDASHTLFRHLGFVPEGIARKYGYDGEDFILYALIKDD
ncbi:hypothetical protein LCGC14_2692910 [marine sediment metagenome]|uniref:N-acetyltransferase domain-containing protein n=1 Tax=marine sediment metagenome TaxID=412755 RepID=A0A0F8ZI43_9ZZZZ